jgi:maltooligosyltrehalose trehalohydrolase
LFMGQEWGATAPFLFFTDHGAELGAAVTEGRRNEFAGFAGFNDPARRRAIPDPQEEVTFCRSRLDWSEVAAEPHASLLRLHRALLAFRSTTRAMRTTDRCDLGVDALDEVTIALWRGIRGTSRALIVTRAAGAGIVSVPAGAGPVHNWAVVLTTNDSAFAPERAVPPRIAVGHDAITISFDGPATVLLRVEQDVAERDARHR